MKRQLPTPRESVAMMEGYHSPQLDVRIRLNTNESPFPPPAEWGHRLAHAIGAQNFHRYPDRTAAALRARIAQHHGVRPEQVFVANGSNEVLQTLCLAYGGPGAVALTSEPTYALHAHISRIAGMTVLEVSRDSEFSTNEAAYLDAVATVAPALAFLCTPNNPTGRVESPEFVRAVLDAVPGLLVVDEAYGQFAPWSALELVGDDVPLVVVRTFSKTWSMAGVRLGYLVGPEAVVDVLYKVVLPYHLDSLKQIAGELALDYEDAMANRVEMLVAERQRMIGELAEMPVKYWPSGANFVLLRPRDVDGAVVWQLLVDRGILVRNCASWPGLDGCLRVTIGTTDENTEFLRALSEVLNTSTLNGKAAS